MRAVRLRPGPITRKDPFPTALQIPQQQRLAAIEATLPPSAYRQLVDLMQRHQNFTLAAKQAYRPDVAPATIEDIAAQQEGLHALRVAHFGEETAEALYGREERISRKLLEFMALEKHEGLTMDEKARKAQEMLSNSPELAEAYEGNRAPLRESRQEPDGSTLIQQHPH